MSKDDETEATILENQIKKTISLLLRANKPSKHIVVIQILTMTNTSSVETLSQHGLFQKCYDEAHEFNCAQVS